MEAAFTFVTIDPIREGNSSRGTVPLTKRCKARLSESRRSGGSGLWSMSAGIGGKGRPESVGVCGKVSMTRSRFSLRGELGESPVWGLIVATNQYVSIPQRPVDGEDRPPLLSTVMTGLLSNNWADKSILAPGCMGK